MNKNITFQLFFTSNSETFVCKCNCYVLTILLRVFIGLVSVSLMRLAGGFLGLVEGMCTAQHLINSPINMMKAIPINNTAHQNSWNKNNVTKVTEEI